MRDIQLIIPMSGVGKRFIEAGYAEPKPFIEVDGKPMVQHVVELFPGIEDIVFIVNEKHIHDFDIVAKLKTIVPNCKIGVVPNENRKGPVDAILQCKDLVNDEAEIIVSYCDYGSLWDFNQFLKKAKDKNWDGAIPCYTGFHPHMLGSDNYAFCKETNMLLDQVKEKEPFTDKKMKEFASNGTYYFKNGSLLKHYFQLAIDLDLSTNHEYYVSMVFNLLVRDGFNVGIFEIQKMLQWGTPYDLEVYKTWSVFFRERYGNQNKPKNPANTTTIIPMAGKGSRFVGDCFEQPKPLICVDDKPMVINATECLPISDHTAFVCLDEHLKTSSIEAELKKAYPSCSIIGLGGVTSGQATTCKIAIDRLQLDIEDPIQISACDNGVFYDESKYTELVKDKTVDVIVWAFTNNPTSKNNPNMYSWLSIGDDDVVSRVSCKKSLGDPLNDPAIIGTMFFRKAEYFLEGLRKNEEQRVVTNGEFYVDDVLNRCIDRGLKVKVFRCLNYVCWGTPDDLKTYNYWKEFFCEDL